MDYQYDFFFSYKRDPASDSWHRAVMEKLRFWLKQELQQPQVSVFFDQEDIRTGLRWQTKLVQGLKTSKAIVCIWSPLYFHSKWCISEWKTFSAREETYQRELVIPASFNDGDCFPVTAKSKQIADFSNYTSTLPTFWDTSLAVSFEMQCLKRFAKDLATLIKQAPPFTMDFPVVEASDDEVLTEGVIERPSDV